MGKTHRNPAFSATRQNAARHSAAPLPAGQTASTPHTGSVPCPKGKAADARNSCPLLRAKQALATEWYAAAREQQIQHVHPRGAARTLPRRGKQRRPKPGAPNPAPQTRRPKPGAPNPAPQTRRPKPGAPNPAPQTRRPKPGGPKPSGPKSGAPNPVAQSSESQKHESSMTCTARPPSFSMGYLAAPASVGRRTREVVAGRRMDGISGTMEAIQSDEKSSILMLAGGGAYLAPQGQAASPPAPGPSRKPASPQARKPASPQAPKPPSPQAPQPPISQSPGPQIPELNSPVTASGPILHPSARKPELVKSRPSSRPVPKLPFCGKREIERSDWRAGWIQQKEKACRT